ncbi:MAG: dipeptide/oligopeptide/nickel ABC transporter permease/ATP-binding protein [Propionibacteriaceae bacterium]|nr:dipeptide/oligopeptide/nickel ABC transporter permease/ATP-binding protein [Propionibacteriaceae bacterium]
MKSRSPILSALMTPLGATGAALITLVTFLAIFAPLIWGTQASEIDIPNMLAAPSAEHWAGTDHLGRDVLARVLVATRLTILLTLEATAMGVVIGFFLGALPYLLGERWGKVVIWLIGILVAFPGLLLALFFAVLFGSGASWAALALGLASAPAFARLCQTLIAGIMKRDYIAAAHISGMGRVRILLRHILPNIGEPLAVNATIGAGSVLLSFAGLSFLGLGVQAPQYDWGRLMNECFQAFFTHPIKLLAPGIAVILAGLAFNLSGESIARSLSVTSLGALTTRAHKRSMATMTSLPESPTTVEDDFPLLSVLSLRDLTVSFPTTKGFVSPVRGVSFDIAPGESVGLVGESGCGKSLTAMAISQLIEYPGVVQAHWLTFAGTDLLDGHDHRELLGTSLAMVFQDPMTCLNPTHKVGGQLAELGVAHGHLTRKQALDRAVDRLARVKIDDPGRRARQYPHEFSGGMRQRAMIGLGTMLEPSLIIADEPTTALDVTVQEQVLNLLQAMRESHQASLMLISHDVSVVREVCDRILIMYAGRIVEDLPAGSLNQGLHPYTRMLVEAVPTMSTDLVTPLATIPGRPPDPGDCLGCPFAPRCPIADEICFTTDPVLTSQGSSSVACWHHDQELPHTRVLEATHG